MGNLRGACLATVAGQGWYRMPSGCLLSAFLGHALCGLGFETAQDRKCDGFGTAFCAKNIINSMLFVHFTVFPQSSHFLDFGVPRGSYFWCCGLPFGLQGPLGALLVALPVSLGRLQEKAYQTGLHGRYILLENAPKRTSKWMCSSLAF